MKTDATKSRLKNCPFCGHAAEYKTESQEVPPFGIRVWIKCPQCRQSQVCSDWYGGDLGTMEASWNTRASPPELLERLKKIVGYWKRERFLVMIDGEEMVASTSRLITKAEGL